MANTFGAWLKAHRKAHRLTQEDLAKQVSLSVAAIQSYEQNRLKPSQESFTLLSSVLDVDAAEQSRAHELLRGAPTKTAEPLQEAALTQSLPGAETPPPEDGGLLAEPAQPVGPATDRPSRRRWLVGLAAMLLVSGLLGVVLLRSDPPAFQARTVRTKVIPPPVLNTGPLVTSLPPDIRSWPLAFEDRFDTNKHHWGLGTKNDGTGLLERRMGAGTYELQLTPTITTFVFLGGDSTYFAPSIYYLSVDFIKLAGDEHADCGVLFDEVSDAQFSMFHIHDDLQQFSIDQVVDGGTWNQHLPDHVASNAIRQGERNTLGLLADGDQFSFYINETKVAQVPMIRVQRGLLDVAIAGRTPNVPVVCQFDNFIVRVPR